MRSEGHFDPRDRRGTVLAIKDAAAEWGVAVPAIGLWSQAAAERVPPKVTARWRLEYDPRMELLSFEVWADGEFVYGSDDIVSQSGGESTAERSEAGVSRVADSHYIASEDRDRRNLWVVTCGCGWRGKPYAALASARFYFQEHQQATGSGGSMPHQG